MKIERVHGSFVSLASTIALHVSFEICFTMLDSACCYSLKYCTVQSFLLVLLSLHYLILVCSFTKVSSAKARVGCTPRITPSLQVSTPVAGTLG